MAMSTRIWCCWLAVTLVAGCSPAPSVRTAATPASTRDGASNVHASELSPTLLGEGKLAYERYCVGCHGENGDGRGEAARFLNPRPRNFVLGNFKFSSTRAGQLPTDADLMRTIRNGLRGSSMPSFNLLPDRTVEALVAYVKTFSTKWMQKQAGVPIALLEDPYSRSTDKSEAIARGEAVYHGYSTCWTCHPAYVPESKINEYLVAFENSPRTGFRPGLFESEGKDNTEGDLIYPPDFKRDFVRAGKSVNDLYRSIAAGITGTAMPTWIDSMHFPSKQAGAPPIAEQTDLWAMAYYVHHLIEQRPARLAEKQFEPRDRPQTIYARSDLIPKGQAEAPTTTGEVFEEE